jgi:F-type H+-transporting ATPase subunit epsilon
MLCVLLPGEIIVQSPTGTRYFATAGGFLEVGARKAILLTDSTEPVEEIDVARAEEARKRALERLARHSAGDDLERARKALTRADNRLREARRRKR